MVKTCQKHRRLSPDDDNTVCPETKNPAPSPAERIDQE